MRDVAAAVGVSVKTVSNVVNSTGQVGESTARAVRAAIEELGYHPNPLARGLNSQATDTVTLALPRLGAGYCAPLAAAVFDLARSEGISVVMEPTDGERERELDALRDQGGLSDGCLLMPTAVTAQDLSALPQSGPAVLLGPRRVEGPYDGVFSQDAVAAEAAVRFLRDRGAERVLLLGGERLPGGDGPAALRTEGYRRALAAAGTAYVPELVVKTPAFTRDAGGAAIGALLERRLPFDAVLATEEPLAHGALHALRTAGIRVPDQVQVMAFGNDEDAQYSLPGLTTVQSDVVSMARRALELLRARIRGESRQRRHIEVPFTINERESTFPHA